MNNSPQHDSRTALVLGGGGSAGNAWLIGVIAGMYDAGLDVSDADLTIGTSAGSTAAAQLTGATPPELYAATIVTMPPSRTGPAGPATNHDHVARLTALIASSDDVADMRRRFGAAALDTTSAGDRTPQWRETVAARFPGREWPSSRQVLITAVDAHTGEPVVFDRNSGVDLVDAVAASCSSGFAYGIGEKRYIDGGFRTNAENADLAAGYARVLVLSPFGGRSLHPPTWRTDLASQVKELRAQGSEVELVFPEGVARGIFAPGGNVMEPSTRPPAARAGHEQGSEVAERLKEFWR